MRQIDLTATMESARSSTDQRVDAGRCLDCGWLGEAVSSRSSIWGVVTAWPISDVLNENAAITDLAEISAGWENVV